jgi:hypothetical protein
MGIIAARRGAAAADSRTILALTARFVVISGVQRTFWWFGAPRGSRKPKRAWGLRFKALRLKA